MRNQIESINTIYSFIVHRKNESSWRSYKLQTLNQLAKSTTSRFIKVYFNQNPLIIPAILHAKLYYRRLISKPEIRRPFCFVIFCHYRILLSNILLELLCSDDTIIVTYGKLIHE